MELSLLVLEYLKVLLTAPVIAGIVALFILRTFSKDVSGLFARIAHIRLPGGSEVFASQQEKSQGEIAPKSPPSELESSQQVQLPQSITLTSDQAQQVVQLLQSERVNALIWEYRYLNGFLARSTQTVLDWLAGMQQGISLNLLDSQLQPFIVDANERKSIIAALQNHHLIQINGELVQVTPKGREYVKWRGPLPPVPKGM